MADILELAKEIHRRHYLDDKCHFDWDQLNDKEREGYLERARRSAAYKEGPDCHHKWTPWP